ncbi:MFS transporter [Rhizobium sp. CECT 9324]|uniref:MFS transporter n=1 Tax=Rhizobium sp. CECT 9324 TaxID=2845820 RepID=UPI001E567F9F|nr:MFS transporter [Rhizobium sp. CECT 9324]CAH0339879.1 Inner membrane protein YbjJ [Rhizobium sp. CECT 9324]
MPMPPQFRIYLAFFLFAMSTGALFARMPDLQASLGLNKAELGMTLIGMAIGTLVSLTLSSSVIVRLGTKISLAISLLGIVALLSLIPLMPNAQAVFSTLFCIGLLAGALEITLNVEIGRIEAQIGFGIMNRAHGCWSLGFFITAITASVIRQAGMSMQLHLHLVLGLVFVIAAIVIAGMKNAPVIAMADGETAPHFALPTLALLPLCLIGTSAFLIEGAGIDWSAIYMDDVFDVSPLVGGSGLTLFAFFMALARLSVDPVVDRYGPRRVALVLLATAALGITLVWLAPHPYVALAGFSLMGGGCSAVYPMAVTAAAQRTDRPAVVNVAALGQMAFVVFFLAPPLLGFVAEAWGMRNAYLVCLPLILGSIFASRALATKAPVRGEVVVA